MTNPRLPSRIRQGLNVESSLNDGVCVPLLMIFLTVAQAEEAVGHVEPVKVVLEEIGIVAAEPGRGRDVPGLVRTSWAGFDRVRADSAR